MEIAGRGVPTVAKKFQELKFQMSEGLKCVFSRMRKGFGTLLNYILRQSSFSPLADSRLHFIG
jgi:hypothetical protein